jgi:osmotically-inducible protein OsmY
MTAWLPVWSPDVQRDAAAQPGTALFRHLPLACGLLLRACCRFNKFSLTKGWYFMSNTDTAYRDRALQELVAENLLRDERVSAQNISVSVDAGVATLKGTVSSYRRKLVAQQIVVANAMIRDVRNELQVEPIQSPSDETIVEHVRTALDTSADVTKETVVVDVVNGKVSLSGNVSSHWERLTAKI